MDKSLAQKYYSDFEVQRAILKFAKDREIAVRFDGGYYGKRPDVIENMFDVRKFVKKGVTSFHCSEERWANALLLSDGSLSDEEKSKNRIGWDLILDLDGVCYEYSRIVGKIIIDYLNELGVKNVSAKFSGNKGFHIGVPFEAFSQNIIGIGETRLMFPDIARKIAGLLVFELKGRVAKALLEYEGSLENIANKYKFEIDELVNNDMDSMNFEWMKVIEIDTILISSRHLFRMPYSLNEKSGLVSVPIPNERIIDFEKYEAKPENVDPLETENYSFLRYNLDFGKDADILLIRAHEEENEEFYEKISARYSKQAKGEKRGIIFTGDNSGDFFEINEEVEMKDFPSTITYALDNQFEDGKKRALFLILTFLHSIKWDEKHIEEVIFEWNDKQPEPLKRNYITAQINWFKSQPKILSPPNFSNDNYYKGIGIPKEIVEEDMIRFRGMKMKNPLHYVFILLAKQNKNKGND